MSYGYGSRQNPYDQRDNGYGQGYGGGAPQRNYGDQQAGYNQESGYGGQGGYGQQPQHQPNPYGTAPSRYGSNNNASIDAGYAGSNVEMAPLAQNASAIAGSNSNAILNELSSIDKQIAAIKEKQAYLGALQKSDGDTEKAEKVEQTSSSIMKEYRKLMEHLRRIKSNPGSRKHPAQVDRVQRALKTAIVEFQQAESRLRKENAEQMARQYRIANPNAREEEVQAAIEDGGGQIFSQAIMQSERTGQAQSRLKAVKERHQELVKIERQIEELMHLFQDMDTLVVQQEAAVIQIEQKGEEVVENLDKGNEEIGVAVNTARKTRKKKWICLGICVAIIVVVVIIVLVYVFVIRGTNNNNGNKRRAIEHMARLALPNINSHPVENQDYLLDRSVASELGRLVAERVHLPRVINQ